MTTFILSHNLQVQSEVVPAFDLNALSDGLKKYSQHIENVGVLQHPHWILLLEATCTPKEMALDLIHSWKALRSELGHDTSHVVLALGGRKDTPGSPGSPLKEGYWGVDLVETLDSVEFLAAINWAELKKGRPIDGVFEFSS